MRTRQKLQRKTIMIDGVRYYADRPHDCRKCFFWKNRKVGCTLGKENCYYLAETVKTEQENVSLRYGVVAECAIPLAGPAPEKTQSGRETHSGRHA